MLDVSNHRWKYLRESNTKYFDPSRNTALCEYLNYIFPQNDFIYDKCVPKDIVKLRCDSAETKRYRPDARSEQLNLIVEFDGFPHYQDTSVVLSDIARDDYFRSLGYAVVRIPYWIQLSRINILHLFNVEVKDTMCELIYSFTDCSDPISACPGNMCEAGRERFIAQFTALPSATQQEVLQDLKTLVSKYPEDLHNYILPLSIYNKLTAITQEP